MYNIVIYNLIMHIYITTNLFIHPRLRNVHLSYDNILIHSLYQQ